MLKFLPVDELSMWGVADPGVPNLERVVLRAETSVNLGGYGVLVGWQMGAGAGVTPLSDSLFWFGTHIIEPGTWLLLYTGRGTQQSGTLPNGMFLAMHWGRVATVFTSSHLVPVLIRLDRLTIGGPFTAPPALPLPSPTSGNETRRALSS